MKHCGDLFPSNNTRTNNNKSILISINLSMREEIKTSV